MEPNDVTFDGSGLLLVADSRPNKGVHVVNAETGKHIQTIMICPMGPSKCLAINHDGHLVVGTSTPKQLLTFKYLE